MGEAGYTRQAARGSTCAHGSVGARLAVGLALWICGSYGPSSAAVAPVANAERGACHTAAAEMEARFDIPRQLLAALALAESGRWNAERRESFAWPWTVTAGVEEVFAGFEPRAVVNFDDEALEGLMSERRIIRHWRKIKSVRDNAAAMLQVSAESGAFGAYLADWPTTDIVGLWRDLARRFSQMGGNSSSYFLRMVDKDTFMGTSKNSPFRASSI